MDLGSLGIGTGGGAGNNILLNILGLAGNLINSKVQSSNRDQGKPQGALSQLLFGTQGGWQQTPTQTPQQLQLSNLLGQLGGTGIQDLIKNQQNSFAPIENKARMDFNQTTVPGIAERFSKYGAQRSSAFGQQLGSAGAGLDANLAALGSQHNLAQQSQQQNLYSNLLQFGLNPQFQNDYMQGTPGYFNAQGQQGGNQGIQDLMGMFGANRGQQLGSVSSLSPNQLSQYDQMSQNRLMNQQRNNLIG